MATSGVEDKVLAEILKPPPKLELRRTRNKMVEEQLRVCREQNAESEDENEDEGANPRRRGGPATPKTPKMPNKTQKTQKTTEDRRKEMKRQERARSAGRLQDMQKISAERDVLKQKADATVAQLKANQADTVKLHDRIRELEKAQSVKASAGSSSKSSRHRGRYDEDEDGEVEAASDRQVKKGKASDRQEEIRHMQQVAEQAAEEVLKKFVAGSSTTTVMPPPTYNTAPQEAGERARFDQHMAAQDARLRLAEIERLRVEAISNAASSFFAAVRPPPGV